MGCCGSKDNKNAISPEQDSKGKGGKGGRDSPRKGGGRKTKDGKPRPPPLAREEMPWRRQAKEKTPEPPKEIEIFPLSELAGHSQNVDLCGWHPGKPILFTAGTDRRVYLWDLSRSAEKPKQTELELTISESASCFHWSEDGKESTLAIGTDRGCVYLWSDRGEKIASWQPHGTPVGAVKTRGRLTLSVSDLVCVYNEKDKSWQVSAWTEAELTAAEWVTDRQFLVADSLGCITMDSAEENQFMPIHFDYDPPIAIPEHQYKSHFGGVYQLRVHPKRPKIFASCSVDNTIKIWNVDKDTPQRTLDEHFGYVLDVQWLGPSGDFLASSSHDGTVRLWDPQNGDCLHALEEHKDKVSDISVTDDGSYLASAGSDGSVHLWAADIGALINTHDGPGRIMRVAFSRHRPEFLAATSYGALEVLRLEFNKRVARRKEEEEEEDFEPVDENFGLKTDRDEGGDRRGGGKGRREERGRGGKKDNDSGYSGGEEEDRRDRRSDRRESRGDDRDGGGKKDRDRDRRRR